MWYILVTLRCISYITNIGKMLRSAIILHVMVVKGHEFREYREGDDTAEEIVVG